MDDLTAIASQQYIHSVLRERIVEHVFVGEVLRRLWQRGITDVEVLRSEFDAGGYDLVMSRGKVTRHIQFKSVMVDGKAARTSVSLKLLQKPSGCVIWIVVTPALDMDSFLWFGGLPGHPLPDISDFAAVKHTKGNADGVKFERPGHRVVPRRKFERLATLDAVLHRLFGALQPEPQV
ncbi:hypothetical protein [Sphingobium sp. CFD-1]|uniref:hypothetical protein n=1 Tax=Sphingobium sp. CFD-1 TaxID=2878545 RepID=UPI00214AC0FF|nr:hypothetical protein [Sphingobium sp. CFD-1]